jgi:hypothetical protein
MRVSDAPGEAAQVKLFAEAAPSTACSLECHSMCLFLPGPGSPGNLTPLHAVAGGHPHGPWRMGTSAMRTVASLEGPAQRTWPCCCALQALTLHVYHTALSTTIASEGKGLPSSPQ